MTVDDVIWVKTFKSSFLSNKNNSWASWCCCCQQVKGVVSELLKHLAFWTISYNWMKTKQEGASLLYKLTSIRVWLHMGEGGASCPAGERGRMRFCLSAVQHHVLQRPRLTVTSCLSDILALKADVSACVYSGVQATSMWQVRVKGGGGWTLPEGASLPDQDLQSPWMICYLCCTCVTALCMHVSPCLVLNWYE